MVGYQVLRDKLKYLKIIIIFIILNFNLNAISLRLLNNKDEILEQKEIKLLVKLDKNEVLLKSPIIFSINDHIINIVNQKISIEPDDFYIASFRQNKKVFNKSFSVDLFLNSLNVNFQKKAFLFMQYLTLNYNTERISAETIKIALSDTGINKEDKKLIENLNVKTGKTFKDCFLNFFLAKKLFKQNLEVKSTIQYLKDQIIYMIKFVPFLFCMIIFSFLFFLMFSRFTNQKKFIVPQSIFIKDILIFITFTSIAGILFHLKTVCLNKYFFIFIAIYFYIVSNYYFITLKKINGLNYITKLIFAICFGAFVLPLIIKAFII